MNDQGAVEQGPAPWKKIAPAAASGTRNWGRVLAVCVFLLLAVGLVFGQTTGYQFVNFDDNGYVCDNPQISGGFSARAVAWVFTHEHGANWHPLTGLSHLLDCQLFGLHAGAHHLTNVLLHAATAVALFLVLWQMTGALWPSALVAGLFAVHPLRVESVAWIAERKDVLSGLMFVLSLAAYVRYVRSPFSLGRYLLLAVVFALGLMAKPMLVTLPAVLLLLDYWPLGRFAGSSYRRPTPPVAAQRRPSLATHKRPTIAAHQRPVKRPPIAMGGALPGGANVIEAVPGRFQFRWQLVIEKLPLLLLAALSCLTTLWAQGSAAALNRYIPLGARIANALIVYVAYLVQLFWPAGLAAYYPHPEGDLPAWKVFGALVVLACLSLGALACRRRYPYLLVGWLWYVGMLVPVIGIVQVGSQAMADRYTYLPQVGLYIASAWGAAEVCRSWPYRRGLCGVGSALVLVVLMGCAWRQTCFWPDSETLWTHALACTSSNCTAQNNLGEFLIRGGRVEEAMAHYQKALEIRADYIEAHSNLGNALGALGRIEEAMAQYRKALELNPDYAEAHTNFGYILTRLGRFDEAMTHYRKALAVKPDTAELQNNVGLALAGQGQLDEAAAHYHKALELKPDYVMAHNGLALVLGAQGKPSEALAHFRKALKIKPDNIEVHANLGNALLGLGRGDEALEHLRKVVELMPEGAMPRNNLGVVLATQGRFAEALVQFRQALQIQPDYAEARKNLAWLRATCPEALLRNGAEAVEHARRADQVYGGKRVEVLDVLAAAYAEAGRFPDALSTARKALELATQQKARALAEVLRTRIALYEAGKPFHLAPPKH